MGVCTLFDIFITLFSSMLFAIFSISFRYELKSLKRSHPPIDLNVLALKIMKLLIKIYRNLPSALIALSNLDSSCQLMGSSSKSLARSFFIKSVKCSELDPTPQVFTISHSASYLKDVTTIIHLLQSSTEGAQRSFLATNIRSTTTLALTSIIMAPIPITLLATFYGDIVLKLLPLVASLFYGLSLKLSLIVFRSYMKLLV